VDGAETVGRERRGRPLSALRLTPEEEKILRRWAYGRAVPERLAQRSRIVLECAAGRPNVEVARRVGVSSHTVGRWRARYVAKRVGALASAPSPGPPVRLTPQIRRAVADLALAESTKPEGWSTRQIARRAGVSQSSASRIQRELALAPAAGPGRHREPVIDTQRVVAMAGLHFSLSQRAFALVARPPHAPVASIALPAADDRAAYLRERFDRLETLVHRTTTLSHRRHSSIKLRGFLKAVARALPEDHLLHIIATSQEPFGPAVRRWLHHHETIRWHRTASRAAWIGLLHAWCEALAARPEQQRPLAPMAMTIDEYLAEAAAEPRPLTWVAAP
jgi:transposase